SDAGVLDEGRDRPLPGGGRGGRGDLHHLRVEARRAAADDQLRGTRSRLRPRLHPERGSPPGHRGRGLQLVRLPRNQRMRRVPPLGRSRVAPARVLDLTIERDGGATLAASYSPAGDTAVVALHGASEGTRKGVLYEHLHRVLPPRGIGVVTFDRRGEGE